jgi:hypothetical protein
VLEPADGNQEYEACLAVERARPGQGSTRAKCCREREGFVVDEHG